MNGATYWPFPYDKRMTKVVCVWCKHQYTGLLRSWRLLAHILWGECADPWG